MYFNLSTCIHTRYAKVYPREMTAWKFYASRFDIPTNCVALPKCFELDDRGPSQRTMDFTFQSKGSWSPAPSDELPSTPKVQSARKTASDLLASFSPVSQSKKDPQIWTSSPNFPITMSDQKRKLRRKEPVHYEIPSSGDSEGAESAISTFSSPVKRRRSSTSVIDLEEEFFEDEPPRILQPRVSSAGHSLRQHSDIQLSLRAQENGDKPVAKRRRVSNRSGKKSVTAHMMQPQPSQKTARNEIRDQISRETAVKRVNFYVAKKEYFLPLLPESNNINRLVEAGRAVGQQGDEDLTIPYEALEQQPEGYGRGFYLCCVHSR